PRVFRRGAGGEVGGRRRPGRREAAAPRGGRVAAEARRIVPPRRRAAAEGRAAVRAPRHRQDALGEGGGDADGGQLPVGEGAGARSWPSTCGASRSPRT